MGKNQLFGSTGGINFSLVPGEVIATVQLGNIFGKELQNIFDRKKVGKANEILDKVSDGELKTTVSLRAVTISQLMNDNERWCINDFCKQGEKFNLFLCVAEAVILASCEVACNGKYESIHFAMQPKFFSWGTCGVLSLCPNDKEYKISPVFFDPRFDFDPETVWVFMEIIG